VPFSEKSIRAYARSGLSSCADSRMLSLQPLAASSVNDLPVSQCMPSSYLVGADSRSGAPPAKELQMACLQLLAAMCSHSKICAVMSSQRHHPAWVALVEDIRGCLRPAQSMEDGARIRVIRASLAVVASVAHNAGALLLEPLLENDVILQSQGGLLGAGSQGDGAVSAAETLVYQIVMAVKGATMPPDTTASACRGTPRTALGSLEAINELQLRANAVHSMSACVKEVAGATRHEPCTSRKRALHPQLEKSTAPPVFGCLLSDLTRLSGRHTGQLPPSRTQANVRTSMWERIAVAVEGLLLLRLLATLKTSSADPKLKALGGAVIHSLLRQPLCVLALQAAITNIDDVESCQPFCSGTAALKGPALATWAIDFLALCDPSPSSITRAPQQLLVDVPLLRRSAKFWSKQLAHHPIHRNHPLAPPQS
jgi:hypothetical protein